MGWCRVLTTYPQLLFFALLASIWEESWKALPPPRLSPSLKAPASLFYSSSLDSLALIGFLRFCLKLVKTWRPEAYAAYKSEKLCGWIP